VGESPKERASAEGRTVAGVFRRDHEEVRRLSAGLDPLSPGAAERAEAFARRLERHMAWEEEILYPALTRAAPARAGAEFARLRAEHSRHRGLLAALLRLLREGGDGAQALADEMRAELERHAEEEERLVYSEGDRILSPAAAGRILAVVDVSAAG
jgi:iron-sulfur cluster repair protein YtfE (RIC family)